MALKLGYKASAEQFPPAPPARLLDRGRAARAGDRRHLRPLPAVPPHGRPCPGVPPVARRARRADRPGADRDERAHADDALPPVDDRPGVRDPRVPQPRPRLARRRHRRGAERDARHRRRVARREGAPPAPRRGDRADAPPLDGRARHASRASTTAPRRRRSTTAPTSRCRSTSPPRARSPRSSPAGSATGSS